MVRSTASSVDVEVAGSSLRRALAAEEAHAAVNVFAIEADWLQKMRVAKLQELQIEVETAAVCRKSRAERHIRALQALLHADASLKEHMAAAEARHARLLDSLLARFAAHVSAIQICHSAALEQLQRDVAEECGAAAAAHDALCSAVSADMAELQRAHDAATRVMTTAFNSQRRELRDVWDERCGVERLVSEERLAALHEELRTDRKTFLADTKEHRGAHDAMLKEDADDGETIAARGQQLTALQEDIAAWRQRLASDAATWRQQVGEAKAAKADALARHAALQRKVAQARRDHEHRMKATAAERWVTRGAEWRQTGQPLLFTTLCLPSRCLVWCSSVQCGGRKGAGGGGRVRGARGKVP